jgi:hypothetical protein
MKDLSARVRGHLTYANVVASLALFLALGGGAYAAATLPRNSVGPAQLRTNSVGASEIRSRAVRSSEIANGSIRLVDLSSKARADLRGNQGPAGVPGPAGPAGPSGVGDRAAVDSGGGRALGNALGVTHPGGSNEYTVQFSRDVSSCVYAATLSAVQNGPVLEQPPAGGRISAQSAGGANVLVRTYDGAGSPTPAPFHLLVSC